MPQATLTAPDLDAFCRLNDLGLTVTGQHIAPDKAVLECRIRPTDDTDRWCRQCGQQGIARGTVTRHLAHVPFGHRPTQLKLRIRRYRCPDCQSVWRQNTMAAAWPRTKLSRHAALWALRAVVIDRLSITRVAAGLGVAWNTANDAVLDTGRRLLINAPGRLDGVQVIGVDEHVWSHTGTGSKYVTVIIDLTPIRAGTGTSRLLDMVPGRSKQVFKTWLAERTPEFRNGIEIVAMDGFTGYKSAATEEIPAARAVMDPFHVVALAGEKIDQCRQRVQQATLGRRGRSADPLYGIRRVLHTGAGLLTSRQAARLAAVFACEAHVEVEVTWSVYQRIVAAYRDPDRVAGRRRMQAVIASLARGVPEALTELITLGRTLKRRAADVLAFFDHPGSSNGPTEAINGRLEHLRGTALGFRNLAHYIARSLLDVGGFRTALHPHL
ncbi:ISL3 family transposase [Falsarthrobacter nasiphocae]|uniref:Transposase n=1 Tax=Falsarthrobacter nasiphocae TaxID=189863 RepID=A0AAE3YDV1_9MICC|nr:ISL3 family transposase [Falsarthrobacter nasiphocae]MDR6891358.1 transposase [Falsarthrobacter nasiphocae]MDR6891360.1 transposase [Falsarthrobacter nasiphocae]MDR6891367.1 transposase [Falsarthrobacter nasiphocae]MDR6892215.1 transposase [Falsarthrobacter nasiphocae]